MNCISLNCLFLNFDLFLTLKQQLSQSSSAINFKSVDIYSRPPLEESIKSRISVYTTVYRRNPG